MKTQQIKFRFIDEGRAFGGILVDDKFVICGCCGTVVDIKGVVILQTYNDWMDLSESIMGD